MDNNIDDLLRDMDDVLNSHSGSQKKQKSVVENNKKQSSPQNNSPTIIVFDILKFLLFFSRKMT